MTGGALDTHGAAAAPRTSASHAAAAAPDATVLRVRDRCRSPADRACPPRGAALPGARALVVHRHRGRDVRDADAGPRRRPARHLRGRDPTSIPPAGTPAEPPPDRPGAARADRRRPGTSSSATDPRGDAVPGLVPRAARPVPHRLPRQPAPDGGCPLAHAADQLAPDRARRPRGPVATPPRSRSAACSRCRAGLERGGRAAALAAPAVRRRRPPAPSPGTSPRSCRTPPRDLRPCADPRARPARRPS